MISGLAKKHAELDGLIDHHQDKIKELKDDLRSIREAIKVIDPDYNLREIKAKQPKKNNRYFKSREATQLLLDGMREADGEVSTNDLFEGIARKKGIILDNLAYEDRRAYKATLFTITKRLQKRGVLKELRREGTEIVWGLCQLDNA